MLLAIDARAMAQDGMAFGVSDNQVWCTERVPIAWRVAAYMMTGRPAEGAWPQILPENAMPVDFL